MRGRTGFIYLGTDEQNLTLEVPHPTKGNAAFNTQFNVATSETTSGRIVGHMRGEIRKKQQIGWSLIAAEDWWRLCRWAQANGPFFYIKYFNHCLGEWRVERFYTEGFSCNPTSEQEDGRPGYYTDAAFTLQSTGG